MEEMEVLDVVVDEEHPMTNEVLAVEGMESKTAEELIKLAGKEVE